LGAPLQLVHVHVRARPAPISIEGLPVIDEQLQSLGSVPELAYLERIRGRLAADPELFITVAVLDPLNADVHDKTISDMLVSYATATDTDLIVMTTHGRGGLARLWLGSVADALVRASAVPVLLLRPGEQIARVAHPPLFRQILIPLDGSALAEQILEPARDLGKLTQAQYTLLHVVEPRVLVRWGPYTTPTDLDFEGTQRRQADAQHYLERVARPLRAAGLPVHARVLMAEQATAILEEASWQEIDLIAIATHGRSGLARLLLGSVADKVLRRVAIPLLLYRPTSPYDRVRYQPTSAVADTPRTAVQEEVLR
jgi:nucleotide-binding universal stress UspA family protein